MWVSDAIPQNTFLISKLFPYKYEQLLPKIPTYAFLTQQYSHAALGLLWIASLYHSLQSTCRQIVGAMFHLFLFFQRSQSCTAYCPGSKNSCFIYFVWHFKRLWSRGNLVPIIATWSAEGISSYFLKIFFAGY